MGSSGIAAPDFSKLLPAHLMIVEALTCLPARQRVQGSHEAPSGCNSV